MLFILNILIRKAFTYNKHSLQDMWFITIFYAKHFEGNLFAISYSEIKYFLTKNLLIDRVLLDNYLFEDAPSKPLKR